MTFYYPIPAGAVVTCKLCGGKLLEHLTGQGTWRGCVTDAPQVDGGPAHGVWLVSVERRRLADRAPVVTTVQDAQLVLPQAPASLAPSFVAGPRQAVYVAAPGATVDGTGTNQASKVFEIIAKAGPYGKTVSEIKREMKLKPKSLESVLYRLKLAGVVRAYNASDVRRGVGV